MWKVAYAENSSQESHCNKINDYLYTIQIRSELSEVNKGRGGEGGAELKWGILKF